MPRFTDPLEMSAALFRHVSQNPGDDFPHELRDDLGSINGRFICTRCGETFEIARRYLNPNHEDPRVRMFSFYMESATGRLSILAALHASAQTALSAYSLRCTVPPPGWFCSREPGHSGPCAASPSVSMPPLSMGGMVPYTPCPQCDAAGCRHIEEEQGKTEHPSRFNRKDPV